MRRYKSERVFQTFVILILTLCALAAMLPVLLVVLGSFSGEETLVERGYRFWPRAWSLSAYRYLFGYQGGRVCRAYCISALTVGIGTALHLLIAPMLAWPLARRDFPRRRVLTALVLLALVFTGGMAPEYLVWSKLFHAKNTIWALILPRLVVTPWQILLLRRFFRTNIPQPLLDAAQLDGAGEWRLFFRVVLPLSAPILASFGLLTALAYWNDWLNSLLFVNDSKLFSVQVLIQNIGRFFTAMGESKALEPISRQMAATVLGLAPPLLALPLLSRAYTRVIRLGAVKP